MWACAKTDGPLDGGPMSPIKSEGIPFQLDALMLMGGSMFCANTLFLNIVEKRVAAAILVIFLMNLSA